MVPCLGDRAEPGVGARAAAGLWASLGTRGLVVCLGQGLGTGQVVSLSWERRPGRGSYGSLIRARSPLARPAASGCGLRASSLSLGPDRQEGRPHELLWLRVVTGVRRWWDPSCHTEGVRGSRGPGQPHPAGWSSPIPRLLTQTPPPLPIQGFEFQQILWGCKNTLSAPALLVWEIRRSGEKPRPPGWGRGRRNGVRRPHTPSSTQGAPAGLPAASRGRCALAGPHPHTEGLESGHHWGQQRLRAAFKPR